MNWDGVDRETDFPSPVADDRLKDPLFTNWGTHSFVVNRNGNKRADPHYQEDKNKLRLSIEQHVETFLTNGGIIEKVAPKPDNEIRAEIKTQWLDNR